MGEESEQVAGLLRRWADGDREALGDLLPLVYRELRRLAHQQLRAERADHTLQSTALVNEAFLRLVGAQPVAVHSREHFVGIAARLMRQILVDYARSRLANKRDGGCRIEVEALENFPIAEDAQLLALDDALESLEQLDERQARIVEMKFFGGLSAEEVSRVLGLSLRTVERDWGVARLWLRRQMEGNSPP